MLANAVTWFWLQMLSYCEMLSCANITSAWTKSKNVSNFDLKSLTTLKWLHNQHNLMMAYLLM